ncbi:MAG: hypothetical protein LBR84_06780 [Tannerella sp.]|jgi:hypothetical protein|nr:hypothetical protein [Tannerella sp.]
MENQDIRWKQRFEFTIEPAWKAMRDYLECQGFAFKPSPKDTFKTLRNIKSDLEDSLLPYNFDIVSFATLNNPALKEHIMRVGKVIWNK